MAEAYLYCAFSSDWRERVAADGQYAGLTAEQVADKYNAYIETTIAKFNAWIAVECGVTMRFASLPDIPERVRPYVLRLDLTAAQLGSEPARNGGGSILDQYGQGVHFTTLMEAINVVALRRNVGIGNLPYQFGDQWAADRATRNPRAVRLYVVVPFDGGGYAGGHSWPLNPPDSDVTFGEGALGSWGPSYYVTGKPNPGALAIYGIGLATQEPTRDLAHEMLHGMWVDSHIPVYLVLDSGIHWAMEQKAAFLSTNAEFLDAVAVPPPPVPPPPVTLTAITMGGPASLTVGSIGTYTATAKYSDGSTKPVTSGFLSTDFGVLNITDAGKAAANMAGTASVYIDGYAGVPVVALSVTVNPIKRRKWWQWW